MVKEIKRGKKEKKKRERKKKENLGKILLLLLPNHKMVYLYSNLNYTALLLNGEENYRFWKFRCNPSWGRKSKAGEGVKNQKRLNYTHPWFKCYLITPTMSIISRQ